MTGMMPLGRTLCAAIMLSMCHYTQTYEGGTEYCNMEKFNATCKSKEVIVMDSARYGRMNIGRCVKGNYGYLGCAVDVLSYLDSKCSGRHDCHFTVPDPVLHDTKPCPKDFTSYLDVSYHCVEVENADRSLCHSRKFLRVEKNSGYIASIMTSKYGLGSLHCPWLIEGEPGQRINLTMYNFVRNVDMEASEQETSYGPPRMDVCFELAVISDGKDKKTVNICGGDQRETVVYVSSTNTVEIQFINRKILGTVGTFMFHYQVFGCPDKDPIPDTEMKRSGNTLMVKCNGSQETWYLTCKDTEWVGSTGNCSYGILIVVAIGVALGIFVGGILLGVIILYSRGRHRRRQQPTGVYDEVKENQGVVEQTAVHLHTGHHTAGWYRQASDRDAYYTDEGIVRDYRSPIPNHHAHLADELPGRDSEAETEQLQTHAHGGAAHGGATANYNSFSSFRPQTTHLYESPLAQ